jgi:hypothetical protein
VPLIVQFTLRDVLVLLVLVWSALTTFGMTALPLVGCLLALAGAIRTRRFRRRIAVVEGVTFIGLFLVSVALVLPPFETAREEARQMRCQHRLKQLGLSLWNYYEKHGSFPPAYVRGPDGKPWHSWRVLILPFTGEKALYDAYDFNEPWDGPNNRKLASEMPDLYLCRSGSDAASPNTTSYFAVVGPKAAWPGPIRAKRNDFADRLGQTILLVEIAGSDVNWLEPKDVSFDELATGMGKRGEKGFSALHRYDGGFFHHDVYGTNVAMADGAVYALPENTPPEDLRALLTRAAGDTAPPLPLLVHPLNWTRIVGLGTLAQAFLLLAFRQQVAACFRRCGGRPEEAMVSKAAAKSRKVEKSK